MFSSVDPSCAFSIDERFGGILILAWERETPSQREICALLLDRKLKTVFIPKWHFVGWHTLISFSPPMRGCKTFQKINTYEVDDDASRS